MKYFKCGHPKESKIKLQEYQKKLGKLKQ